MRSALVDVELVVYTVAPQAAESALRARTNSRYESVIASAAVAGAGVVDGAGAGVVAGGRGTYRAPRAIARASE